MLFASNINSSPSNYCCPQLHFFRGRNSLRVFEGHRALSTVRALEHAPLVRCFRHSYRSLFLGVCYSTLSSASLRPDCADVELFE